MVASETSKEAVWFCKFLSAHEVILGMNKLIILYCDNMAAIENTKD